MKISFETIFSILISNKIHYYIRYYDIDINHNILLKKYFELKTNKKKHSNSQKIQFKKYPNNRRAKKRWRSVFVGSQWRLGDLFGIEIGFLQQRDYFFPTYTYIHTLTHPPLTHWATCHPLTYPAHCLRHTISPGVDIYGVRTNFSSTRISASFFYVSSRAIHGKRTHKLLYWCVWFRMVLLLNFQCGDRWLSLNLSDSMW